MPQTLAQMVRAKYPGRYDDLSDQQLETLVRAKYPGAYNDLPATPGVSTASPGAGQPGTASQGQTMPGETFSEKIGNAAQFLKDVAIGTGKGAAHTALNLGQLAGQIPLPTGGNLQQSVDALYGTPGLSQTAFQDARTQTAYTNTPQRLGGLLETGAELAVPVTEGASAAVDAIPQTARAGQNFQKVMQAAKAVPVDTSAPGDVALRIADLAQHGGGTNWGPAPVRQFIQYVTDPNKPPMTYDVARDFASNISRLSSKDLASVPPSMMREIANLRVTLNQAVGDAAAKAGMGAEYRSAMNEYAKAMQLRNTIDAAIAGAKQSVPYLTAGGATYWLGNKIASLFGGS